MKTIPQYKEKIADLHVVEHELCAELGKYDKQIREANKQKAKIAKRISHNVKYRNKLVCELYDLTKTKNQTT